MAGLMMASGQGLPVMASPSKEALMTAAALAQGLAPPEAAASPAVIGTPAEGVTTQNLPQSEPQHLMPQQAVGGMAADPGHDAAAVAWDGVAAADGQPQVLCHSSSTDSLSCSEQLSQGPEDDEAAAAGQQAESRGELAAPPPAMAPLLQQGQARHGAEPAAAMGQAVLPNKRKLAVAGEQLSPASTPVAGAEAERQAFPAPALPAQLPAATAGGTDGGPAAKQRPAARPVTEQAAAVHAVGLATGAGQLQGRSPRWLRQPATEAAMPSGMPAAGGEQAGSAQAAFGAAPAAAAGGPVGQQPAALAPASMHHPALSHESRSWQQLDRSRSASPASAAVGGAAAPAVQAELSALPPLQTVRASAESQPAAQQVAAGAAEAAAVQRSEDEVEAAAILQALAAAAGSGSTALEPISPLSPQRPAPELSSLSSSRSALHAHLQPCGTAIEATAPTWVTFHLPAAALGGE